MSLSPNRQWAEFKELIEKGVSFNSGEVSEGTKYLGTFISANPYDSVIRSAIRTQADYLAMRANSVFPAEQAAEQAIASVDKFPNLTKAREARRLKHEAKREAVKV